MTHEEQSAMPADSTNTTPQSPSGDSPQRRHRRRIDDLIQRIKESADQLASDGPARGDLKILSRASRELRYAFKVFSPYRRHRKVTVFRLGAHPDLTNPPISRRSNLARRWPPELAGGHRRGQRHHGGGASGAGREHSMGLNILLPFEQDANPVIAGDHKLVHMKYFFTRKLMFVKECDAVVCLPGGFGTLDEALEVLTLLQTGKRDMVPWSCSTLPAAATGRTCTSSSRNNCSPER